MEMKISKIKIQIGRALKKLRLERGLSRVEISKMINLTAIEYKGVEAGRKNLLISQAVKLARFYGVSLDHFNNG